MEMEINEAMFFLDQATKIRKEGWMAQLNIQFAPHLKQHELKRLQRDIDPYYYDRMGTVEDLKNFFQQHKKR